jgi:hypothetical protein
VRHGIGEHALDGVLRVVAQHAPRVLEAKLGVSIRVTVISTAELADVVAGNPLGKVADNPSRLLVGILGDPADRVKLAGIAKLDWEKERIELGAVRSVYMRIPEGVINSKLNVAVGKAARGSGDLAQLGDDAQAEGDDGGEERVRRAHAAAVQNIHREYLFGRATLRLPEPSSGNEDSDPQHGAANR